MHGEPKYGPDFTHFGYVNPDAPKGGSLRLADTGTFDGCTAYNDFRDVLARDDVDAIIQATPDHWHALVVVGAARAGKDVYGEKPLSLTIDEGRIMSDAIARYGRVFQTGSQQRSDERFRRACELVRNGRIGRVHRVTCGLPTTPTTSTSTSASPAREAETA